MRFIAIDTNRDYVLSHIPGQFTHKPVFSNEPTVRFWPVAIVSRFRPEADNFDLADADLRGTQVPTVVV